MSLSVKAVVQKALLAIFGPVPKFKKGDAVQCDSNSSRELMVIQERKIKDRSTVIYFCKWYDSDSKTTRSRIFLEEELMPFDWGRRN